MHHLVEDNSASLLTPRPAHRCTKLFQRNRAMPAIIMQWPAITIAHLQGNRLTYRTGKRRLPQEVSNSRNRTVINITAPCQQAAESQERWSLSCSLSPHCPPPAAESTTIMTIRLPSANPVQLVVAMSNLQYHRKICCLFSTTLHFDMLICWG